MYINSDAPRPQSPCAAVWTRSHAPRFVQPAFRPPSSLTLSPSFDPSTPTTLSLSLTTNHTAYGRPLTVKHAALFDRKGAIPNPKGKLFERPSSSVRTFGSEPFKGADHPRSFLGNLEGKADVPGPGAYDLSVARPNTSPAAASLPQPMFRSKSVAHKDYAKYGPGPSLYSPVPTYTLKHSMQNVDGRWV